MADALAGALAGAAIFHSLGLDLAAFRSMQQEGEA